MTDRSTWPHSSVAVLPVAVALLGGTLRASDEPAGRLDLGPEDVAPGLIAVYRSVDGDGPALRRVDAKPAFALGHSSPHPRIPPGPFEVEWDGVLLVNDPGPVSFRAFLAGELEMEVDGVAVLRGLGRSEMSVLEPAEALSRPPGRYRVRIRYRSLEATPARLQIRWEGPSFAREPLPAWRLSHLVDAVTPDLAREQEAMTGREAVGRLGCARCHSGSFPGVDDPPPGPSLADAGRRLDRGWLMHWLDDPARVRDGARMPALFTGDRSGEVERWVLAEFLGRDEAGLGAVDPTAGDHRAGRRAFLSIGCVACHYVPDQDRAERADPGRSGFDGLADRMGEGDIVTFLGNPHGRYPDGRMPRLPVSPVEARDISAYLRMWSTPSGDEGGVEPPTAEELRTVARRLGVRGGGPEVATALLGEKGCLSCHPGLGSGRPLDIPLPGGGPSGCAGRIGDDGPRYTLDAATRAAIAAYLEVAGREVYPAPFDARQRQLARVGCVRCHQRDTDRPPPVEEVSRSLGGAYLQVVPYQRTPRLTDPHEKLTPGYLAGAVREGVSGLRSEAYTFRMPAFGPDAVALVQAIAEADGAIVAGDVPEPPPVEDPTLGTLVGAELVGSRGYGCISCHVWDGEQLSQPDPGAVGPDLTRVVGRIRRDWFDRFVRDPSRFSPGTPMPAIFPEGRATLTSVLGGDSARQRDALWAYFSLGSDAPAPQPPPPVPVAAPRPGEPALVAQIPVHLPDGPAVESICVLNDRHDLIVYDLAAHSPRAAFVGGRLLRTVQGRTRRFLAEGEPAGFGFPPGPSWKLVGEGVLGGPIDWQFQGYDRLGDGVRVRSRASLASGTVEFEESVRIGRVGEGGQLDRSIRVAGIPSGSSLVLRVGDSPPAGFSAEAATGVIEQEINDEGVAVRLTPDRLGAVSVTLSYTLPGARPAPTWEGSPLEHSDLAGGERERPGYRAVSFPRPKTASGEDRVMPASLAVDPEDGRLFVSSLKTGELFVVNDPRGDASKACFEDYTRGLFQDAFSMLAEEDGLYVLHRRNLTRAADTDGDGRADRFDRVAGLPHGVADTYDYAYGLVRDREGGFILSYAPYANASLPGSGGVLRIVPGQEPEELAFGLRNPLGWCVGPDGAAFFTDNQGEWVASNKLCHVDRGRFYGFPNPSQPRHAEKPAGRPVVWVPYAWARSINGVAYDHTGGRFGPFSGQFFLAELMYGGAIVRASVERVNGQYQGACFPFWGEGLLGPVSLAFDPAGHLYVGGITEPGWMAQPDRGALFRIDFTGETPFEMRTIHAMPRGFRLVFTAPIDARAANEPASYRLERYRYEYTGSYGSPELDRSEVGVEGVVVSPDGRSVELTTGPLKKDHVYLIDAAGVRSTRGEALVHPAGAYTLNEIPGEADD